MTKESRDTFDFIDGVPTTPGFYVFKLYDQGGEVFKVDACVHDDMTVTIPQLNTEHLSIKDFWNLEGHQFSAELPSFYKG
jgi:hypothetical protein